MIKLAFCMLDKVQQIELKCIKWMSGLLIFHHAHTMGTMQKCGHNVNMYAKAQYSSGSRTHRRLADYYSHKHTQKQVTEI